MTRTEHATRGLRIGAAVLCLSLLAAGAGRAAEDLFERGKAAYDEAAASNDGEHAGYTRAWELWRGPASEGDVRAMYHIGILHMYGLGEAPFDMQLAVRNVKAAADGGYPMAQSLMGFLTERSDGTMVTTGDAVALDWWRKGAEGGHCAGVRRMQRAYENGELGLAPDPARAAEWAARREGCSAN